MKNFIFIMMTLILCVGCRSSRQETSKTLTDIRLEELISQRFLQFHTGSKVTDIHHQDLATIIITEYNAPDSTRYQSKKTQTVISACSQTTTSQQETDTAITETIDTISRKMDIHQSKDREYKLTPVPWYSGLEPYIALAMIAAIIYFFKRLKIIKLSN